MDHQSGASSESLNELFKELFKRLYYSVSKLTKDHDLLNFVVSKEVFDYYQKGYDLRSDDVIRQLYVAVRHRVLDALDKKKTHDRIDNRWMLENMPTDEDPHFYQEIIKAEFMHAVKSMIENLPPRYREAVEGYYIKGIPAKELARMMGIRVGSVHRLKDLGVLRLIKLLKDQDFMMWLCYFFFLLTRDDWKN